MLGFGAGNQDIRSNAKIPTVEFLASGDVLGRFALQTLVKIAAKMDPRDLGEFFFRMGVKIDTFAPESMRQEDLRGEAAGR